MNRLFLSLLFILSSIANLGAKNTSNELTLTYDRPADYWVEALPLGNGRLGAMVYGGLTRDTIQINEDSFWSGSPYNNYNPNAKANLQKIRDCINAGQYEEAQKLAMANITADRDITAHAIVYESLPNL